MTRILLFIPLLLLCGCLSLTSSEEPLTIYALHASRNPVAETVIAADPVVISIPDPVLPAGLKTDRIALYLDGGRRLDFYSGARWAAPLDEVLQDMIIDSGRGAIPHAIFDGGDVRLPARYRLVVSVVDFYPLYSGDAQGIPLLKVSLSFTVIQASDGTVLARFSQSAEAVARENSLTAITSGLEQLLQSALADSFVNISGAIED